MEIQSKEDLFVTLDDYAMQVRLLDKARSKQLALRLILLAGSGSSYSEQLIHRWQLLVDAILAFGRGS